MQNSPDEYTPQGYFVYVKDKFVTIYKKYTLIFLQNVVQLNMIKTNNQINTNCMGKVKFK